MLAKGRLIGVQFEALLEGGENSIYFEMAAHANEMAGIIRNELTALGIEFYGVSQTNQVFPILPVSVVEELEKDFFFYRWAPEKNGMIPIRLVTAWGTEKTDVDLLVAKIKELYQK